jgi:hypothetical protein
MKFTSRHAALLASLTLACGGDGDDGNTGGFTTAAVETGTGSGPDGETGTATAGDGDGDSGDGDGDTGDGDGDGDTGDGDGDPGDGDGDSGDGDGDGDTGDGDGDAGDGDGDTGENPLEAAACDAVLNGTPEMLVAAISAGDAATAPVVANGASFYMITLPDGAAGFVQLEIPEWETTRWFFTVPDIDYTITTDANAQTPGPRELVAACPDAGITGQSVFFPHWTPATIEFGATGPREIPFMIIPQ